MFRKLKAKFYFLWQVLAIEALLNIIILSIMIYVLYDEMTLPYRAS